MWIYNGGIDGSFPFYIFMFGAFTFSVVKGKRLLFFLSILLLVSVCLIILGYIHPEIIVPYPNKTDKFYDILINYILVFVGMSFLMYYYTKQYYSYNKKLNISNKKLEETNLQLSKRVKEREVLLKEIHHRVKNNLQMVISLLNLQINTEKNEELNKLLQISQDRINAISIVHEQLYKSETLESININEYLTDLINNIAGVSNPKTQNTSIDINIENAIVGISKTIPIGLIINELISNSLKYAFNNNVSGIININGFKKHKKYIIIYRDNGKGMPTNFKIYKSNSLGFKLIDGLINQIDGIFEIKRPEKGTEFKIQFEVELKAI